MATEWGQSMAFGEYKQVWCVEDQLHVHGNFPDLADACAYKAYLNVKYPGVFWNLRVTPVLVHRTNYDWLVEYRKTHKG